MRIIFFILIINVAVGCAETTSDREVVDSETRQELIQRKETDQQIRKEIMESGATFEEMGGEMIKIDSSNTAYLKQVVNRFGWPDSTIAGKEASRAAFLIAQHSPDHEFQEQVLEMMDQIKHLGGIDLGDYALLYDRVEVHAGRPQLYGSQAFSDTLGYYNFYPIADSVNIDTRRAQVGLMPFKDYFTMMKQNYKFR